MKKPAIDLHNLVKVNLSTGKIVKPSMRNYLSKHYLDAASMFTRKCRELESNNIKDAQWENSYYAMAAVKFSYSAIEAKINEFCQNIVDPIDTTDIERIIGKEGSEKISFAWKYIKRFSTFRKYNEVMIITDNKSYDHENPSIKKVYKRAKDLEQLRDALIHYKPEDSSEQDVHKDIEITLKKYKIPTSRFFKGMGNPYFPDRCLGFGLSRWSIYTSIDFIESFYTKLGLNGLAEYYKRDMYKVR